MNKKVLVWGLSGLLVSTVVLGGFSKVVAQEITPSVQEIKASKADVTSWADFKDAIEDETVTDITLTSDLVLEGTLYVSGTVKNIHGNGHTIDAAKHQIAINKDNTKALLENSKIQDTDIYGLFWSLNNNVEVTYRDIEHNGDQLIYLPSGKLVLDGTVTSISTVEEVFQGKEIEVLPNAIVNFENTNAVISPVSMLYTDASLKVGSGAVFNVNSKAVSITGGINFSIENEGEMEIFSANHTAIHGTANSVYDFKDGSVLKAVANDPIEEGVQANEGSMFIRQGATFEVESRGTQGTVIAGNQLVFEEGSNFSITNHNNGGAVFGSYPTPVNVFLASSKGINTWNRGNISSDTPDDMYTQSIDATFDLNGYLNTVSQTNMVSSNSGFADKYSTGKVGKITGGSYVHTPIEKPSLNAVNDKQVQLTGTGIPGATINVHINGQLIGTATVDSNSRWSMRIALQTAGTEISVNQTVGTDTSESVTQIVSHLEVHTVEKPGFDTVSDKDTQLTGTGIPGATIRAYTDGQLIGTTTVESDASWKMTILQQKAGTEITVNQTVGFDTSDNVAQIVTHISEI